MREAERVLADLELPGEERNLREQWHPVQLRVP